MVRGAFAPSGNCEIDGRPNSIWGALKMVTAVTASSIGSPELAALRDDQKPAATAVYKINLGRLRLPPIAD